MCTYQVTSSADNVADFLAILLALACLDTELSDNYLVLYNRLSSSHILIQCPGGNSKDIEFTDSAG